MRRIFFACVTLCVCLTALGDNKITVSPFTLSAGDTIQVDVNLENDIDFGGMEFRLYLPKGVSMVEDEYEPVYEITSRLQYRNGRKTVDFTNTCDRKVKNDSLYYYFLIYNTEGHDFAGNSGEPILTVTITASDQITTGTQYAEIKNQVLSTTNNPVGYYPVNALYACTLQVDATVPAVGYATFSWPRALDFTGTGVEAYIGTQYKDGWLHLEPVTKVPANTGIILKGNAKTYHPETIDSTTTDDASANLLTATAEGAHEVSTTNTDYALANHTRGIGFYPVKSGVSIPQYKAYLTLNASEAKEFVGFDKATAIDRVATLTEDKAVYTLGGVKVNASQQGGIYIQHGKKFVKGSRK